MKNKSVRGSLFTLLARNYLLFTLTLLAMAAVVFALWNAWLDSLYQPPDWDGLLKSPALSAGDYDALRRHLGRDGNDFAVYDDSGALIYATGSGFDAQCEPEELGLVQLWDSAEEINVYELTSRQGEEPRCLLVRRLFSLDGTPERTDVMVLDSGLRVIFGGLEDGRTGYTRREFLYLTGARFPNASLYREQFADQDGRLMTVLLRSNYISDELYFRHYSNSWRIWLLCIPLYLAGAGLFIWWMRRKIGRPLQRLNDAVVSQSEGRVVRVGNCGGPREIRLIGESFDRFSDRLAESEAERRRLDQGRQKLIADISHDLKTPITVIAGYIDAICDGKVPPEETGRYLRAIQGKAEALTELVNAFHEYSKVEHPEFVLHTERTDLCEFLREYLAGKYDEIDLAGFSLEVSIPERPVFCALDQLQFRRVLDNLLSNALRHNRLGTVLFFDVSAEEGAAVLRVADNGAGIPPDRIKYIFEPFVVGSDARSGTGSGLGLSITKRIVEKHGGAVFLSPRPAPGRSTEFVLRLPLAP